jgi:hypothetical protein
MRAEKGGDNNLTLLLLLAAIPHVCGWFAVGSGERERKKERDARPCA